MTRPEHPSLSVVLNLKVVWWFVYANDLESYTNSSVATGRTSTARHIKGIRKMKTHASPEAVTWQSLTRERHPCPRWRGKTLTRERHP